MKIPLYGLVLFAISHGAFGQVLSQGLTQEELSIFEFNGVTVTDYSETQWLLEHTGIPDHDIGDFPNQHNPNTAEEQNHDYYIPKSPTWLDTPGCLQLGIIAMAKSGVPFFNPYTAEGLNAIGNEIFDDCQGHPDPQSTYHYHQLPSCLYGGGNNELMGVALDGYAIYGPKDENGVELTTADLDFCHGRWYNGRYQYHITRDFPYVMACYRGEIVNTNPGRTRRHTESENPRFKRQNRPPRPPPGMGPGGGGARFDSCYAYCENPANNAETGCMEPEYQINAPAPAPAPSESPAPASSLAPPDSAPSTGPAPAPESSQSPAPGPDRTPTPTPGDERSASDGTLTPVANDDVTETSQAMRVTCNLLLITCTVFILTA